MASLREWFTGDDSQARRDISRADRAARVASRAFSRAEAQEARPTISDRLRDVRASERAGAEARSLMRGEDLRRAAQRAGPDYRPYRAVGSSRQLRRSQRD